jgi:hypothetical protein
MTQVLPILMNKKGGFKDEKGKGMGGSKNP